MQLGALAMIDALGFRDIWTRYEPDEVIGKLKLLETSSKTLNDKVRDLEFPKPYISGFKFDTVFLSDTVVIGAWWELSSTDRMSSTDRDELSISTVSQLTSQVIALGGRQPIPIAYRGCITFGKFELDKQFLVGPAVKEAADVMDAANAALVWLAPSAQQVLRDLIRRTSSLSPDALWREHDVPIKNEGTFRTWVVSPLYSVPPELREEYIETVLGTFTGDRLGIQVKRQNTERFLNAEHQRLLLVAENRGLHK